MTIKSWMWASVIVAKRLSPKKRVPNTKVTTSMVTITVVLRVLHFCGSCNENVCFECQACWGNRFCWQCMQSFCDKHEKLRYCKECFTDTCENCFEAFQKSQSDRKGALSEASTVAAETEAGAEAGHHSEEGRTVAKPKGKRRGKETVSGFENAPPLCPGCYTNRGGDGGQQSGGCCTF